MLDEMHSSGNGEKAEGDVPLAEKCHLEHDQREALVVPVAMRLGDEPIVGFSRAAYSTFIILPKRNICFDMGTCSPESLRIKHVFLSHTHDDHFLGTLRHASLRRLNGQPPATYYLPMAYLDRYRQFFEVWWSLKAQPDLPPEVPDLVGVEPGDIIRINHEEYVKVIPAHHRITAVGFQLYLEKKKLKRDLVGRPGEAIAALKQRGVEIHETVTTPFFAYLGDHDVRSLLENQDLGGFKNLAIELTSLEPDQLDVARKYMHMHLQDLLDVHREQPDYFRNDHLILKHFSIRYPREQVFRILEEQLPADLKARTVVML